MPWPRATSASDGLPLGARAGFAFVAGVVASQLLLPAQPGIGVLAAGLGAGGVLLLPALSRRSSFLLVLLVLTGVARGELPAIDDGAADRARALAGMVVVAEGRAAADATPVASGYTLLMEVSRLSGGADPLAAPGRVLVRSRLGEPPAAGDPLTATGRLRLPAEGPGFDRRAYLAQRGAWLELVATQVTSSSASGWEDLPGRLRAAYRQGFESLLPQPHAAILTGIVLGVRQGIPAALQSDLVATGLVHLLVLSGLKVAILSRLASSALTPLLGPAATVPVLVLVGLYALAGGATPAAVRAAAMGGLVLLGRRLGRPSQVWTSLALVAAAMLAWAPGLVFDVGFQLSFLGTGAIVLLTAPIEDRIRWLPGILREPLAVTTAAQVGTLPVTAAGFHVLSPIAPLANAITLPLLPLLIVWGLLLGPLALVPSLGRVLALPIAGLLAYLEQAARLLAAVPGAALPVADPPPGAGIAYYAAALGAYRAWRSRGRARGLAIALGVGIPLLISGAELGAWVVEGPAVTVLDVGDGQAVLAGGPQGWILVDGGPDPQRLAADLGRRLPPWQRRLQALFVTAPAAAHVGGLVGLRLDADSLVIPRGGLAGEAARAAVQDRVARGASLRPAAAGDVLQLAGMRVEVLAPEAADPAGLPGVGYLALRISRPGGGSFCTVSDLDADAQVSVARRLAGGCQALLLPSLGRTALAPELLRAAGDPALVISARSARPAREFPATRLRRTDQEGAIWLAL